MTTAIRSYAKINLGLYIGAPRPDGFHGLSTVYQTLELHDVVSVTARCAAATQIRLTSNDERVPCNSHNTAWKMVELALEALGVTAVVEIHIDKRLPVQGGLGAGSANGAAALVGLESELGIPIEFSGAEAGSPTAVCSSDNPVDDFANSRKDESRSFDSPPPNWKTFGAPFAQDDKRNWQARRMQLAALVGSDVPLFLIGGAVLGLDRGQWVEALPDIEPVWCVVATPSIGVSTPQAFRDWDALCAAEGLTQDASTDKLSELSRAFASAFAGLIPQGGQETGSSGVLSRDFDGEDRAGPMESALVRTGISSWIENDFERVVFPQHPSLAEIKRILAAAGTPEAALVSMLSGSGSALFGLYQSRGDGEAARERLQAAGVTSQLTRTIPRPTYWSEMLLEKGH